MYPHTWIVWIVIGLKLVSSFEEKTPSSPPIKSTFQVAGLHFLQIHVPIFFVVLKFSLYMISNTNSTVGHFILSSFFHIWQYNICFLVYMISCHTTPGFCFCNRILDCRGIVASLLLPAWLQHFMACIQHAVIDSPVTFSVRCPSDHSCKHDGKCECSLPWLAKSSWSGSCVYTVYTCSRGDVTEGLWMLRPYGAAANSIQRSKQNWDLHRWCLDPTERKLSQHVCFPMSRSLECINGYGGKWL